MRTKTTLLCAAALAAGVASSMAQSNVYSLNIVGYANVPTPGGYTFQSNPFEVSPSDAATNVIQNPNTVQAGTYPGPWDFSSIQTWNQSSSSWQVSYFDSETSDTTTGFIGNPALLNQVPGPSALTSGVGYLINNVKHTAASTNITYVGTVRTGTNSISYPDASVPYAVGSPLPLAGGVSTALGIVNPNTVQQGNYNGPLDLHAAVEQLLVSGSGAAVGYQVSYFDSETSDTATGFIGNPALLNQVPEPQVQIGGGFFLSQGHSGTYVWTQILNP